MEFRAYLKALVQSKCSEHELPAGLEERLRRFLTTADPGAEPR
jgi:hypothetical protein